MYLNHLCISNEVYFAWTISCLENMAEISNCGQKLNRASANVFLHFFFSLQLGIEISFSVVTLNICISWLPIWINQWMHMSVVHIGHEGTEQYTWRNTNVSRWYFFCNVRHFLSYQMNHQENILLFIFRNYLLLVFEKNVTEWTNWTLLNKAVRHNFKKFQQRI